MPSNNENIELLFSSPDKFVLANQRTIEIILNRYIKSGYLLPDFSEDAVQYINLRLLEGIVSKMQQQYNPKFYISTYFTSVVNNLCKEYLNILKKDEGNIPYEKYARGKEGSFDPVNVAIIGEELNKLSFIFRMYNRKRNKLIFSLKIKYRFNISKEDTAILKEGSSDSTVTALFGIPSQEAALKTESDLFDLYAPVVSIIDKKNVTGDSLKRWTYQKIDEIVEILNNSGHSAYNMETLGILLEKYLEKINNDNEILYI